jgi:hemerythrin
MLIKWKEINSVNVKEIDEQHKQLVAIINKFFTIKDANREAMQKVIVELMDYANFHLRHEEELFDKFQYVNSAEHKQQHAIYRQKVLAFQKEINEADYERAFSEMSVFMRDWWIFHINNSDVAYSECFNQNGLY